MIRPKGLGRGLDALLASTDDETAQAESLQMLPVDRVRAGRYQPRTRMDAASLAELALSIKEQGVMQPILVRPVEGGRFEIVAGERRWRAAQQAGLHEVPALVRNVPDQAALAVALIENIQREDLNPLEEARGLQRLIEEFGLTHEAAAKAVGRSRSAVSNLLRLTGLAPPVQEYLLAGKLEMGHARALLGLTQRRHQVEVGTLVAKKGLSVRETEALVRSMLSRASGGSAESKEAKPLDPNVQRLQDELSEKLGAVVQIQHAANGKGKVVVSYHSLDELDGILAHIR